MVATVTFVSKAVDTTSLTVYTFSSLALGAAASDRKIVVAVASRGGAQIVSSLTIGGISATLVVAAKDTVLAELWQAAVPSGTTGDVVVTMDTSGAINCGVGVFRVLGALGAADDTGFDTINTALNDTLDIPAGGVAIGCACVDEPSATFVWTNLTEAYDEAVEGAADTFHTGAKDEFASQQSALSITCTVSSAPTNATMALASWGPVISIDVPTEELTITTIAPTVFASLNISVDVPTDQLALSFFAPTVSVSLLIPALNLTLTFVAPTKVVNFAIAPPVEQLEFSFFAPTIDVGVSITVPVAQLTITRTAPSIVEDFPHIVPVEQLEITPTAPAKVVDTPITVPLEQLAITATASIIEAGTTIPVAQLAITPTAPSFVEDFAHTIPFIDLTITLTTPQRVQTTNPAPAETPWRDEDGLTDGWVEESEAA